MYPIQIAMFMYLLLLLLLLFYFFWSVFFLHICFDLHKSNFVTKAKFVVALQDWKKKKIMISGLIIAVISDKNNIYLNEKKSIKTNADFA